MQISHEPERIDNPSVQELVESPSERVLAQQPVGVRRIQGVRNLLPRRARPLHPISLAPIDVTVQPR